ncbi:MAG: hypothetical protein EA365_09785, partial [Gloeocapsa sp. DLM2.Bin57]
EFPVIITQKDEELANLQQQLEDLLGVITKKDEDLVTLQHHIGDIEGSIQQKEEELATLQQLLAESQGIIGQKDQELANLQQGRESSAIVPEKYQEMIAEKEEELATLHMLLENSQEIITKKDEELRQLQQNLVQPESEEDLINKESEFKKMTFTQLENLLVYYPSICKLIEIKPNVTAKNFLPLFSHLDKLLQNWGYEKLGTPGEEVRYNPEEHQTNDDTIQPGDLVYIRFIGYKYNNQVITLPKVTRNFPS